jgi:hypothetical protein
MYIGINKYFGIFILDLWPFGAVSENVSDFYYVYIYIYIYIWYVDIIYGLKRNVYTCICKYI